jgi:hypothetical protein
LTKITSSIDLLSNPDADLIGILGGGLESSDGIILHILQVNLSAEKDKERRFETKGLLFFFSCLLCFTNEKSGNTN